MAGKRIRIAPHMGSRYVRSTQGSGVAALQSNFRAQMAGIIDAFMEFCDEVDGLVPDVLVDVMEPTFGKALEYCPEDSGKLKESGYLEKESRRGNHVVAIGFGKGGQPDYAIYVHELPYAHEAPTRWKFLQSALDEDYFTMLNSIPAMIRERAGT